MFILIFKLFDFGCKVIKKTSIFQIFLINFYVIQHVSGKNSAFSTHFGQF